MQKIVCVALCTQISRNKNIGRYIIMKIWKVLKSMKIVAYAQVIEDCTIFDDGYEALLLVRNKLNDFHINGI